MLLEGRFPVSASAQDVWDFFLNIDQLVSCLPGVEMAEQRPDGSYYGILKSKVGPVRASFETVATLLETDAPTHMVLRAEGKEGRTGSTMRANLTLDISPRADESPSCDVSYSVDMMVAGRLAQFGQGVIRQTSAALLEEFARNIRGRFLENDGESDGEVQEFNVLGSVARRQWRRFTGRSSDS